MIQTYWLKTKTNSNTPTNQLEHKMDQDLNPWRVKNTWTATRQTHNLLHDCTFNTIHHLNNSWAWAIDAETTINKKAISGTELMDKLIHQMAVWPLRGTPTGRRNGPKAISGNSAQGNAKCCSRGRITPRTGTLEKNYFFTLGVTQHEELCPGRLWSFHPWKYSKPGWTQPWTTCSIWPCCELRGWMRWSPEVPSWTSHLNILWLFITFSMRMLICNDRPNLSYS